MDMLKRSPLLLICLLLVFSCGKKTTPIDPNPDKENLSPFVSFEDADSCLADWATENEVVVHLQSDPQTLHPTNEFASAATWIFSYVHSYLMVVDLKTLELKPDLVKSAPTISEDGKTYEFELRDNISWSDNSAITSNDVVFTYKVNSCLLTNNTLAKPYIETLDRVDAVGDNKFKMILKEKYILNEYIPTYFPILQQSVYDPGGVITKYSFQQLKDTNIIKAPPEDLGEWMANFNSGNVGSGPENILGGGIYELSSWEKNQSIILTKKTDHWTKSLEEKESMHQAYPERIIFKVVNDENTAKIELQNQGVDVTTYLTTSSLVELEGNPDFARNYNYAYIPSYSSTYLMMNTRADGSTHSKFFVDKNVRRAMAHLTPVDDVIKVIYSGKADRLVGPMHPNKRGFNDELTPIALDIEKAQQILDDAGWKDNDGDNIREKEIDGQVIKFEFELLYPSNSPVAKDIADLVSESMQKGQINAKPVGVLGNELVGKAFTHDFDMVFFAFGQSALADDFKQLWHTEEWANNGANISGFGNEKSDALIDSIRVELDWKTRIPMLRRFQQMVYDEQPVVFFMAPKRKVVIHKRFGNSIMYFERPGVQLNTLKALCPSGS